MAFLTNLLRQEKPKLPLASTFPILRVSFVLRFGSVSGHTCVVVGILFQGIAAYMNASFQTQHAELYNYIIFEVFSILAFYLGALMWFLFGNCLAEIFGAAFIYSAIVFTKLYFLSFEVGPINASLLWGGYILSGIGAVAIFRHINPPG